MTKIGTKQLILDFITGKKSYKDFSALLNSNFDVIMTEIQNEINKLSSAELNQFFEEFSHPVFEEINYILEEQNKVIQDKIELLKQFGKPVPESMYKNDILYDAIIDRKKEIIEKHKDIKGYFCNSIDNNGYEDVYGRKLSFIIQDIVFDFFAKIYDGLYGRVQNKNFEYKIRKSLIIDTVLDEVDTVLDELVRKKDVELENVIENKIFIPTQYLTNNVNPTLKQYNKRLKEVKKLIQEIFWI